MTRFGTLLLCATLGLGAGLVSCGSSSDGGAGGSGGGGAGGGAGGVGGTEAVLAIVPVANTVPGWTIDPSEPKTAGKPAAIAFDYTQAEVLIDGGADPFYTASFAPDVFAWQNYVNATVNSPDGYHVGLYVLKMPSAAQATAIYDSLLDGTKAFYSSNTWADTSPAIGDKARIANSGTDWWINFRKGAFYCEVRLDYAEAADLVGKQQVIDFATAVASKI